MNSIRCCWWGWRNGTESTVFIDLKWAGQQQVLSGSLEQVAGFWFEQNQTGCPK